jgi:transposase
LAPVEVRAVDEVDRACQTFVRERANIVVVFADLDRKVMRLARANVEVRPFMTAPGIGPIAGGTFLPSTRSPGRCLKGGLRAQPFAQHLDEPRRHPAAAPGIP